MPKMVKLLITGGCGFIGREVTRQAVEAGHKVRVADNLSKPGSNINLPVEFLKYDLTDSGITEKAFKDIDVCIHLAAKIGGIGYFHKFPATILSDNNKIYSSVFESAAKAKIKQLIYISSSMVFESAVKFPSKEDDVMKVPPPVTSYGFSKLAGEWYCSAFKHEHNLNYTIIRPFNAYGTNEEPGSEVGDSHVIPDIMKKILIDKQYPVEILGSGAQTRCFTHVRDIASAILLCVNNPKAKNESFNVSNSKEIKIIDLIKMIFELSSPDKKFKVKHMPAFQHDIKRRVPDVSKIKKVLGWSAKTSLESGLRETLAWFKKTHLK